jgi:IS605 OrfB family transposase
MTGSTKGTLTDGKDATIIACRELRSGVQYTNKRLAVLRSKQDGHKRGSRRWKRLQRRKARFLAPQKRRARDLAHKASRAVVDWAEEHSVGTLAFGDVRDVSDGKRLRHTQQQQISQWGHGTMRRYIGYKAGAAGITVVVTVNEAYTSQTCPRCGHRSKPKGRIFLCHVCGFRCARDRVGGQRTSSPVICTWRWGGCCHHPAQSIVTLPGRASVVAWTRRTWLGLAVLPPAEKPTPFRLGSVTSAYHDHASRAAFMAGALAASRSK